MTKVLHWEIDLLNLSIEHRNLFHQSFYRIIPLRNRMIPPFHWIHLLQNEINSPFYMIYRLRNIFIESFYLFVALQNRINPLHFFLCVMLSDSETSIFLDSSLRSEWHSVYAMLSDSETFIAFWILHCVQNDKSKEWMIERFRHAEWNEASTPFWIIHNAQNDMITAEWQSQ